MANKITFVPLKRQGPVHKRSKPFTDLNGKSGTFTSHESAIACEGRQ